MVSSEGYTVTLKVESLCGREVHNLIRELAERIERTDLVTGCTITDSNDEGLVTFTIERFGLPAYRDGIEFGVRVGHAVIRASEKVFDGDPVCCI